ncbi:hypothetical protein WJX77_005350 [Trebouxia sp. C0004]
MKRGKQNNLKAVGTFGLDIREALSLKHDLNSGQAVSQQQILHILQADRHCDGACKSRKDNPNCLCGVVPAAGSFRRKGLWQKEPQGLMHLGASPSDQKRQDAVLPCGLNNLGNTCYVNSALQCLFMTPIFRNSMYQIAAPAADDVILGHIRRLFVELQSGPRFSADPKAFAQALNLDHTIQQDGQEFLKLLLSLLETKLAESGQPAVQSLVPDLFRGSYAYETICKACGRASQGSNRATHFYELDIQVKGSPALGHSLADMLCKEELSGDNQYLCDFCGKKVDATRQLCLRQLPPYLCMSLQRFVFDMKKLMKVKASDKFSFPLSINLGPYLCPVDASLDAGVQVYDLQAILIHKGSSASQGHYVAHIHEEGARKWWRFDDETVTVMPDGPIGEKADHGGAPNPVLSGKKSTEKGKYKPKGKGRKRKASGKGQDDVDGESTPEPVLAPADDSAAPSNNGHLNRASTPPHTTPPSNITSSNAYMLLYKKRDWQPQQRVCAAALPVSLQQYVDEQNQEFETACANFETTQQQVRKAVMQQQADVRGILDLAPVAPDETDCRFISADWLMRWADSDPELTSIDNSALQCPHGKLLPNKSSEMKRISMVAWEHLVARCRGGPEFGPSDVCTVCLMDMLHAVASADEQGQAREGALAIAEGLDEQETSSASLSYGYYVSKTWLQGWKKKQGRSMSNLSPTDSISCPHGALLPAALGPRAKRTIVPPPLWDYFKDSWHRAEKQRQLQQPPASTVPAAAAHTAQADIVMLDVVQEEPVSNGNSVHAADKQELVRPLHDFPAQSSHECRDCLAELDVTTANGQVLASEAEEERMQAAQLAAGTPLYLEPGTTYTLMPRPWLQLWRAYVNGASKRGRPLGAALPPLPPSLVDACQALFCRCHSGDDARLAYQLPDLAHRRGKWMQSDADSSVFEVVSTADCFQILARHAAGQDAQLRQIEASLHLLDISMDGNTVRVEGARPDERVISDNVLEDVQKAQPASMPQAASLHSNPPVCEDTIERQEADALAARLVYKDVEVMVELVAQADFKPDTLNLTGDRKSKRARKGRAPIKVSAHDTIHHLKLKIVQTLNVHPRNTLLHLFRNSQWQPVSDDDATLADHSILPDEELVVINTHEHDDEDLESFFGVSCSNRQLQPERGFTGTALSSHAVPAMQQ